MKKIPVIFFLLCIISIFIFNKFKSDNIDVLYLGESDLYYEHIFDIDKYKIEKYLYDNVLYREILNNIKKNDFKVIKEKNIYLNQKISASDVIILNAQNFEYKNKCKKIERVLNDYDDIINKDINDLIGIINKISDAKIVVIGNYCENKNYKQNLNLSDGIYLYYENIDDLSKIISKSANN